MIALRKENAHITELLEFKEKEYQEWCRQRDQQQQQTRQQGTPTAGVRQTPGTARQSNSKTNGVTPVHNRSEGGSSARSDKRKSAAVEKFNNFPTFDGTGDVDEFIDAFLCIVEAKEMDEQQQAVILRMCVKGKAARVINNIKDSSNKIPVQLYALRSRFGTKKSFTTVANELKEMRRRPMQSVEDFAGDVEDVAHRAAMPDQKRGELCRSTFVSGLNNLAMAHYIDKHDEKKDSIEHALFLAKNYEFEFGTATSTDAGSTERRVVVKSSTAGGTKAVDMISPVTASQVATIQGEDPPKQTLTDIMTDFTKNFSEFRKEQSGFVSRWNETERDRARSARGDSSRGGNGRGGSGRGRGGGGGDTKIVAVTSEPGTQA